MQHIKDVNVVLYDPNHDLRTLVIGILREIGFTAIASTEKPETVKARLGRSDVDLLIGDVPEIESAMCALVSDVRTRRLGKNPFPVAIGMTSYPDENTISNIVDAGFDGLALKPFDAQAFRRRLTFFLHQRKPFVTTADYIGPDRRKEPGKPGVDANCVNVPNPLRLIAEGVTRDTLKKQIEHAGARLDERKVISCIGGIGWCASHLDEAIDRNDGSLAHRCIKQLNEIAMDIDGRLERTPFAHMRERCNELLQIGTHLEHAPKGPEKHDVEELNRLVDSFKRGCNADQAAVA
ncbi:MAG: hypothetical protein JJ855_16240 [Rhodospirillales bacterium]|nr:hypothetical protein [Rhodospirillales bacterium]